MPGSRSRQGCEECRKRRRKCDEKKPNCGQCLVFSRTCRYTLKVVWGAPKFPRPSPGSSRCRPADSIPPRYSSESGSSCSTTNLQQGLDTPSSAIPKALPNGMALPRRYRRLLEYFAGGILASLSCHPVIHEDLCRGLIPAMLHSPHLLSAGLALSATGFVSRGFSEVDGIDISRVIEHLQTSGFSLLRTALAQGQRDEILMATCLIWCLADVFAGQQGRSSWRIHLQGIKALLEDHEPHQPFASTSASVQSAMRHLLLLYRSLQTLPYLPTLGLADPSMMLSSSTGPHSQKALGVDAKIDGFLGYSEELLDLIQQINKVPNFDNGPTSRSRLEADTLLDKLRAMISRDAEVPLDVSISSGLSPQSGRDFTLCHKTFQQATLIQMYRQLYDMPSGSPPIQCAVEAISSMINNMTQGQPCNTWVAMAMPLFTVGCEAFREDQKSFILDKIHKFEVCLGSLHVQIIRQALEDIWKLRADLEDFNGELCATRLLEKLQYNIILF